MIIAAAIVAGVLVFGLGVFVGASLNAPYGHEGRDGFFIDRSDFQASEGARLADSLSLSRN